MANYTQQDVIKKFMASLDTTTKKGTAAANEAIAACSSFKTLAAAVKQFLSDCNSASSAEDFLVNKCGIVLDNTDTGAITGKDAGGSKVKTAESIVPESSSVQLQTNFNDTSFTVSGQNLTFRLADANDLNDADKKKIWQSLYTWWAKADTDLIAESFGKNFSFSSNSSATAHEIVVSFFNSQNGIRASTPSSMNLSTGETYSLALKINMAYCPNVSSANSNGPVDQNIYLDRTIAHELTHATMAANIKFYGELPQYIREGIAELTHGIDDDTSKIPGLTSMAGDSSALQNALNGTGDLNSAGYMFMRWLAKQASTKYPPSTSTSSSSKVINGTSGADSLNSSIAGATIYGNAGNDTIDNYGASSKIDGGAGKDLIYNRGKNTYITSGTDSATIYNYAENVTMIGSDKAGDYLHNRSNKTYLYSGNGNSTLYSHSGTTNVTMIGGSGNDTILNNAAKAVIKAGSGKDTITNYKGSNVTISGGAGNDYVILDSLSSNSVIQYSSGDGNDTLTGYKSGDSISLASSLSYQTVKSGSDMKISVKGGDVTIKNAAKSSVKIVGGKSIAQSGTSTQSGGTSTQSGGTSTNSKIINGTDKADTINNTVSGAVINALAGNDAIHNRSGSVTINCAAGNDSVYNYSGSYILANGDSGNDYLSNGSSNKYVTLYGGSGNDVLNNWAANSFLDGGSGNDTFYNSTTAGGSKISGGSGNDSINNRAANVTISGGSGNDTIVSNGSKVTMSGGAGNDVITLESGSKNNVIQYASGDGNDTIYGYNSTTTIQTQSGATYKYNSVGNDVNVTIGSGVLTLKNAKGITPKITSGYTSSRNFIEDHWFTSDDDFIASQSTAQLDSIIKTSAEDYNVGEIDVCSSNVIDKHLDAMTCYQADK